MTRTGNPLREWVGKQVIRLGVRIILGPYRGEGTEHIALVIRKDDRSNDDE